MPRADLIVAIGNGEHCVGSVDAAAQIFEQIERCFVRPVHVFEHDERLLALQLIERRVEDGIAGSAGTDRGQQRSLSLSRDVVQRRERPGCEERVTRAPKYARVALHMRKLLQQDGLSDTGLTRHERDDSRRVRPSCEAIQPNSRTTFALEQFHRVCTARA